MATESGTVPTMPCQTIVPITKKGEGAHGQSLSKRGHGPIAECHADHGKADDVAVSIAQKVQCVS